MADYVDEARRQMARRRTMATGMASGGVRLSADALAGRPDPALARRMSTPQPSGGWDASGVYTGGQWGVGSAASGYATPPSAATDAAIQRSVQAQKENVAARRSGPLSLGDYLNHEFLQRQAAGTPAWEVGTIANKTYPQATDRVQIIGPNKIRIVSGVGGAYYTDPRTGRPVNDPNYTGGSRDISTGKLDPFTYVHAMEGFAPNADYKAAWQTASDKLNNYKPADRGVIDYGPAAEGTKGVGYSNWGTPGVTPQPAAAPAAAPTSPGTDLPGTHMVGNRVYSDEFNLGGLRVPAIPTVFTTENRYLNKGGVETPVEQLTPQERVSRGVGGFWDTLLHSPASEKVREWLSSPAGRTGPALAPSAPAGPPIPGSPPMSPGLTAVPAAQRSQFVEGGAAFNPNAPVKRAVPVGQATGQAARVQSPTNASERPRTETTPMDVNKTDLSSQPTPGITGGNQPTGPQGNVTLAMNNPPPYERNPWEGF